MGSLLSLLVPSVQVRLISRAFLELRIPHTAQLYFLSLGEDQQRKKKSLSQSNLSETPSGSPTDLPSAEQELSKPNVKEVKKIGKESPPISTNENNNMEGSARTTSSLNSHTMTL